MTGVKRKIDANRKKEKIKQARFGYENMVKSVDKNPERNGIHSNRRNLPRLCNKIFTIFF